MSFKNFRTGGLPAFNRALILQLCLALLVLGLVAASAPIDPSSIGPHDRLAMQAGPCADQQDNDGDGFTDLNDPGCRDANDDSESEPTYQCDDAEDNDFDNKVDWQDPDCTGPTDNTESPQQQVNECQDQQDNDGDGFTDANDPGCAIGTGDTSEYGSTQCDDGINNDNDQFIDYPDDSDCTSPSDNTEAGPTPTPTRTPTPTHTPTPSPSGSPTADLSISIEDSVDPAAVGEEVTYTITVTNLGPNEPSNARVHAGLSEGFDFPKPSSTEGTCTASRPSEGGDNVVCHLGAMTSGETDTVTIKVKPYLAHRKLEVRSSVHDFDSGGRSLPTDPNMSNNTDVEFTKTLPAPTGPMIARPERAAGACHDYPEKSWIPLEGGGFLVIGTSGRDHGLWGSDADDIICGLAGDDRIRGFLGADVIFGHGGRDNLDGAEGDDYLSGGDDQDDLRGWEGDDELIGGTANDSLIGDSGEDTLSGSGGDDILSAGSGTDLLYGGAGEDRLGGGKHGDELYGGDGPDVLEGDTGNDRIFARNEGIDTVRCGGGTRDVARMDRLDSYADSGCETVMRS